MPPPSPPKTLAWVSSNFRFEATCGLRFPSEREKEAGVFPFTLRNPGQPFLRKHRGYIYIHIYTHVFPKKRPVQGFEPDRAPARHRQEKLSVLIPSESEDEQHDILRPKRRRMKGDLISRASVDAGKPMPGMVGFMFCEAWSTWHGRLMMLVLLYIYICMYNLYIYTVIQLYMFFVHYYTLNLHDSFV